MTDYATLTDARLVFLWLIDCDRAAARELRRRFAAERIAAAAAGTKQRRM